MTTVRTPISTLTPPRAPEALSGRPAAKEETSAKLAEVSDTDLPGTLVGPVWPVIGCPRSCGVEESDQHAGRLRAGRGAGAPDAAERWELVRTLGAALKELRAEAGMTQQVLGRRAGVSHRMLQDLERGRRRPSRAMLHALAVGSTLRVPPVKADPEPVCARLVAAARGSLVVDTRGGVRRRERRLRDARHQYVRDVDAWWQLQCAAARQAEMGFVTAIAILDQPGALDDLAALEAANRCLDVYRDWMAEDRRIRPPMWVTSDFRAMARRHGYSVSRKRRAP